MKKTLITLLFLTSSVIAQDVSYTTIGSIKASDKTIAKYYGLTKKEVEKYKNYMDIEGRFRYPNADPITVLGMIADSDEDRYRYARKAAKREIEANKKLALFSQAFGEAGRELANYQYKDTKIEKTYTLNLKDELIIIADSNCDNTCILSATTAVNKVSDKTTLTIYKKEDTKEVKELIDSINQENESSKKEIEVIIKNYDEFEFEISKIRFNRVMVKRNGRLLGLYQ